MRYQPDLAKFVLIADGARLILRLTRVLADFHETPRAMAPAGVVHRDVKPANVFLAWGAGSESRPVK